MVPKSRRQFMQYLGVTSAAGLTAAYFYTPGLFAEQLALTPPQTEGPYYPDRLPLDRDNDLIIINDSITPAVGQITHLTGRVLDRRGHPVRNALVEIWQCDGNAVYLHSADQGNAQRRPDANFQGFGRSTTNANGQYRFRTIKPVPYPGRPAPHIHFKIHHNNREVLTTQLFVHGHEGNQRDGLFRAIRSPLDRELVLGDFTPIPNSTTNELAVTFDIVLGITPDENRLEGTN